MTSLLRRIAIRTLLFAVAFGIGFARADAGTAGINGTVNVSAANTVVNLYDVAVSASGRTIVTTNIANLQNAALGPVGPGSVLLVYQAQGATIDSSNTVTYGNVTAYNGAGYYEFVTVGSVSGNTITIAASCNALAHTYGATTQIVRVPQYQTLTVAAGASITATAWNGSTGGIVAFDVAGNLTLSGSIVTTGQGFRGAVTYANSGASFGAVPRVTAYVTGQTGAQLASALAAEKGESIAGNGTAYDASFGGRYGRGAPANGGGGGDGHNAGGGGGSNGDNGLTWSGQGLEDTAYDAFYSNANLLNPSGAADPGYNSMKSGSGGGRGGYTYGLPLGSGFADDGRRPVGGLGGRPMNYSGGAASRVFFGGGGGAGDQNNGGGGSGGNGGGIVLLNVGSVSGAGSIVASGAAGGTSGANDAAGGGGGGGAVVVLAGTGSVASIVAAGGAGGNQVTSGEAEGPGGGGGGGYVAATASSISVAGAAEGTTAGSTLVTNGFAPYGATLGTTGGTGAAPTAYVYCYTPVIGAAKLASTINNGDGSYNITYSVFLQNYGDTPLATVTATDDLTVTFPTGTTFSIANAPAVVATTTGASATVNAAYNGNAVKTLVTAGALPIGGSATVTFTVKIVPPVGTQTYSNSLTTSAAGTTGNANGAVANDTSNNGANPDPAGYGNPNQTSENVATPITIYGQSAMTKTVRNVTTNEATGLTVDNAVPGNQLEYTISFPNATGIGLKSIVVTDAIPAHTTYKSAACGALASGVTACTATLSGSTVTYTVTGTLATGATQTFLLDVTVN